MRDFMNRAVKLLAANFRGVILFYALLTAASLFFASRLTFESSFEALLPRSFPSVQALDDITNEFGGTGYLVLDVKSANLEKSKRFSAALAKELEKLPEVRYVNWRQPKKYFDDRRLLFMDLADLRTVRSRINKKIQFEKQKANPLFIDLLDSDYKLDLSDIEKKYEGKDVFRDYYVSEDGKELVLLVKPSGLASDLAFSRRLVAAAHAAVTRVNPAAYDPSIEVAFTGRYQKQLDLNAQLRGDVRWTIFGSIVLASLLLVLYFRQVRPLLLISLPLVVSLAITFALAYFMIGYVNIISAFLISILMGVGLDYGIVFYSRYSEERLAGADPLEALARTGTHTGRSVLIAGLTTSGVFFSLMIAEFKGFSQFGLIAGTGVILNVLLFTTLFPALVLLMERLSPPTYRPTLNLPLKGRRTALYLPVLALCAAFLAYSAANLKHVGFEYNFSKIQGSNIPSFVLDERVNTIIGTSLTPDLALVNDLGEAAEVSKVLEQKEKNPDTTIDSHASLLSFMPEDQQEKLAVLRDLRHTLDDSVLNALKGKQKEKLEDVKRLLEAPEVRRSNLPPEILRMFSGGGKRSAVFIFPKIDLGDAELVKKSSDEIRDLKIPGRTVHPCSESIIFSDILNMISADGELILLLAFFATALPVLLAYRSFKAGFFILTPLAASALWIFGTMALFHMKFNFFNVIILPLVFGLGVDYCEYVYSRYLEMGRDSVPFVMLHTGPAVLMSALTTIMGFGTLLFAKHNGLNSLGQVAVIGIVCAFLSAVILLPAMLTFSERITKK